jgi:hypothetical protein
MQVHPGDAHQGQDRHERLRPVAEDDLGDRDRFRVEERVSDLDTDEEHARADGGRGRSRMSVVVVMVMSYSCSGAFAAGSAAMSGRYDPSDRCRLTICGDRRRDLSTLRDFHSGPACVAWARPGRFVRGVDVSVRTKISHQRRGRSEELWRDTVGRRSRITVYQEYQGVWILRMCTLVPVLCSVRWGHRLAV